MKKKTFAFKKLFWLQSSVAWLGGGKRVNDIFGGCGGAWASLGRSLQWPGLQC